MKPRDLLDPAACARLEEAVRAAEQGTSGEIVVAVARASDEYRSVPWRLGAALAALVFLALAIFAPPLPLWVYLLAQAGAVALAHGLARSERALRTLVPDELLERRVHDRAGHVFLERGLQRTAGKTGILIFISLLEHRVVVLGDEGIDRVLDPDETWTEVVALAIDGLRNARPLEGLEAAITRCGEILKRHIPPNAFPEPDELPNHIVLLEDDR